MKKKRPAPTPETIMKELDVAERSLVWLDRLRWPAAALPVVGGVLFWLNFAVWNDYRAYMPGWYWTVIVLAACAALCFGCFTWLARHFRRVIDKTRSDLLEKFPDVRPRAQG